MGILTHIKTERAKGSDYDDYSTFLNTDEELVKKIKNHPIPTSFKYWPETIWKIEEYEGDEVKCTSGRDVKYFKKNEVEESIKKTWETEIEELYPPLAEIVKQFFPLMRYHDSSMNKEKVSNWKSFYIHILSGNKEKSPSGWAYFPHVVSGEEYSLYLKDGDLEFKFEHRGAGGSTKYDEDGNFVNRDYNWKLQDYTQDDASFALLHLYGEIVDFITNLGPVECLKNATNTFFTQTHCIKFYLNDFLQDDRELNFIIEKLPMRSDGRSYKKEWGRGNKVIPRPSRLISLSQSEFFTVMEEKYLTPLRSKVNGFSNL